MSDGSIRSFKLRNIEDETRKTGFSHSLFEVIDSRDTFFGGRFLMATNSSVIKIEVNHGSYQKKLPGPCRSSPLENELTEDILHFRDAACHASASDGFYDCTRHYRSFLQSSVSLVDCFINRYVELYSAGLAPGTKIPFSRGTLEDRLDAWAAAFAAAKVEDFKRSAERGKFTLIRKARNKFVHATEPYVGVSIQDLPDIFNAVRRGIGGLLLKMRELAGQPTLGFIERLRVAQLIAFKPK
jgi:hypothetical protein